jgi:hypothetical protein
MPKKTTKPENPRNYNMCDSSDTASVTIGRSEIDEDIANPDVCVSGLFCPQLSESFSKKWARGHIRDAIVVRIRRTSIISTSLMKKVSTVGSRIAND